MRAMTHGVGSQLLALTRRLLSEWRSLMSRNDTAVQVCAVACAYILYRGLQR